MCVLLVITVAMVCGSFSV